MNTANVLSVSGKLVSLASSLLALSWQLLCLLQWGLLHISRSVPLLLLLLRVLQLFVPFLKLQIMGEVALLRRFQLLQMVGLVLFQFLQVEVSLWSAYQLLPPHRFL